MRRHVRWLLREPSTAWDALVRLGWVYNAVLVVVMVVLVASSRARSGW